MKFYTLFIAALFMCSLSIFGQSPAGTASGYYSGIQGVTKNPGQAALSAYRLDINIFSVNPNVGSDYFGIDLGNLSNLSEGLDLDNDSEQFPKNDNNFFLATEILGPSALFNISSKQSVAITTRVRAFFNLNRISGTLYEEISNNFDEEEDFVAQVRNFNGTLHAWTEIGATYSHLIVDENDKKISVGGTLKYLMGAGSVFLSATRIDADYDAGNDLLISSGDLSYGGTVDFDNDDITFNRLTGGVGLDLGGVFEMIEDGDIYKYRIGLSITDIGGIKYKNSETNRFQLDNTVNTEIFDTDDLEEVLKLNYDFTTVVEDAKISLPTALNAFIDYNVNDQLFVAAETSLSMISNKTEKANRINSYFAITPRFEGKTFGVYSPIGIYQYSGLNWGIGGKLGPVHIGSSTILTNLISSSSRRVDIYLGFKIPFYK